MDGEIIEARGNESEARMCEAHWINHYREAGMPLTNQLIPALSPQGKKRKKSDFKVWRMKLPEDSAVLQDLFDYGHELGMPLAETVRVVLAQWSWARRNLTPFRVVPQFMSVPLQQNVPAKAPTTTQLTERERAKARGTRFARTLALDDE
jgi:hypothetical protein